MALGVKNSFLLAWVEAAEFPANPRGGSQLRHRENKAPTSSSLWQTHRTSMYPHTVMLTEAGDLELNMYRTEQMICLEIMNWNSCNTFLSVGVWTKHSGTCFPNRTENTQGHIKKMKKTSFLHRAKHLLHGIQISKWTFYTESSSIWITGIAEIAPT